MLSNYFISEVPISSVNMQRRTSLMEALYYGHGAIAEYLISEGASTFVKDEEGMSILDVAKRTLDELEDVEWMLSRMETKTRARCLERKSNQERFRGIIDMQSPQKQSQEYKKTIERV